MDEETIIQLQFYSSLHDDIVQGGPGTPNLRSEESILTKECVI